MPSIPNKAIVKLVSLLYNHVAIDQQIVHVSDRTVRYIDTLVSSQCHTRHLFTGWVCPEAIRMRGNDVNIFVVEILES